jgi:very-short-patch-repair endonuclease
MAIFNDKEQKQFRRDLRKNASRGEVVLWSGLRKNGVGAKFRRQESIEQFVVDFYCPELGLAVEVDGIHHEHRIEQDTKRDSILENIGVRTVRFKDSDVISNSENVLDKIKSIVTEMRETSGSYRKTSTQLHPDEKARRNVGRGGDETKPPPGPRLGKAGELSPNVQKSANNLDPNQTL